MEAPNSDTAAPSTQRLFTKKELTQVVWPVLVQQFPSNVDFNDPRVAASLECLNDDITETARDAAAAIKKDLDAAVLTRSSESPGNVTGTYMPLLRRFYRE